MAGRAMWGPILRGYLYEGATVLISYPLRGRVRRRIVIDDRGYALKERCKPREVDRVCDRAHNLLGKNILSIFPGCSVILVGIELLSSKLSREQLRLKKSLLCGTCRFHFSPAF
jgi:hypothetical protein